MKGLITLLLIVFFGWCFGSTYWYVCKIKGLCADEVTEITEPAPTEYKTPELGNLVFSRSNSDPETNERTSELLDSLRLLGADTLIIVGQYFIDEEQGEALGISRARKVQEILTKGGYEGASKISSKLVDREVGTKKLRAVNFQAINNPTDESKGGFSFIATDEKIVINFPVASADPHGDQQLINQLKEFASQSASDGSKIMVSGHTDNTGTHDANIHYGQLRADVIANLLIEYGVDAENIDTVSKGESEPLATNDTKEGRRQNRRVEIEIISN
ncbi:MAG: OmpA family protein [Bacteroidota bacterium]